MLCARCQKNEATIHFTAVVESKEGRSVHLCKDCAPPGIASLTLEPKHLEAGSVTGKNCEFCARASRHPGVTYAKRRLYWCEDCGTEFWQILTELFVPERPYLMQRIKLGSIYDHPEVRARSEAMLRKAVEKLKERSQQDGQAKDS